jgi:hypothetical protein
MKLLLFNLSHHNGHKEAQRAYNKGCNCSAAVLGGVLFSTKDYSSYFVILCGLRGKKLGLSANQAV